MYEEKTKKECKYEHSNKVPLCHNGTACSRTKCMFKHPNLAARKSDPFLEQSSSPPVLTNNQTPHTMNPWQTVVPNWTIAQDQQNRFSSPWQTVNTQTLGYQNFPYLPLPQYQSLPGFQPQNYQTR